MRSKKKTDEEKRSEKLQLEYSGNVTVQVVRNNGDVIKTVDGHNAGTYRLFEYIAKCLANVYESSYSPKYVQLFHAANSSDTDVSSKTSLVGVIAISTSSYKSDKTNNSATASLTFTIPGELFVSQETPNLFALYSTQERTEKGNPMALYYMSTSLTGISDDTNVIITWELTIGNKA